MTSQSTSSSSSSASRRRHFYRLRTAARDSGIPTLQGRIKFTGRISKRLARSIGTKMKRPASSEGSRANVNNSFNQTVVNHNHNETYRVCGDLGFIAPYNDGSVRTSPPPAEVAAKRHHADPDAKVAHTQVQASERPEPGDQDPDISCEKDSSGFVPKHLFGADVLLPSGKNLRTLWQGIDDQCCKYGVFNLENESIKALSSKNTGIAEDLKSLNAMLPLLNQASPCFDRACEAWEPFAKDINEYKRMDPRMRPVLTPPSMGCVPSCGQRDCLQVWDFVSIASQHFAMHHEKIDQRSQVHSEGWYDVNVWNYLLDRAYIGSDSLSVDRKELEPHIKSKRKHDGIVRGAIISKGNDVGFIEVKPDRSGLAGFAADREKIVQSIADALCAYNQPGLLVGGIICRGLKFTVLVATLVSAASRTCVSREYSITLRSTTVSKILRLNWRLRSTLEESQRQIIDSDENVPECL